MALEAEVKHIASQPTAAIKIKTSQAKIGDDLGRIYQTVHAYLEKIGGPFAGPPYCLYHDVSSESWSIEAGFPVAGPIQGEGEIASSALPGGKVATAMHTGPYDRLSETWMAFESWVKEQGIQAMGPAWESYITDPGQEPDSSKWKTLLVWSIR